MKNRRTRWGWMVLGGYVVLAHTTAWAQIGAGGNNVPLTDWLIELYNVTNNVYVPLIGLAALVFGAGNLIFGFVRMGPVLSKIFLGIGILSLGVAWFAQRFGGNAAIGLLG
jgi:hypothetical protein